MSKPMNLRMKIFKFKRFMRIHRKFVFAVLHFLLSLLLMWSAVCFSGLSYSDFAIAIDRDPLFNSIVSGCAAALCLFWSVFLSVSYCFSLFSFKKPKCCPAVDCLNFNCGHFDRKYMVCELTEVSCNE